MIRDDVFVFDNVVHMYDYSDENLKKPDDDFDREYHLKKVLRRRQTSPTDLYADWDPVRGFARKWTSEEMGRLLFKDSGTDMVMAQAVVLYDIYKDGFAPVQAQYEFSKAFPDRVLFCGGVDPMYPSVEAALDEIERQVTEMGSRSMKFYNAHIDGRSWRCDDPKIAYPLYEKCLELGLNTVQFHKGNPITRAKLEDLSPLDIQQAAMDFPDLHFGIHHLAVPFFDEVVWIASRFPNVFLVISGIGHTPMVAPWTFKEWMGRLLRDVGADRILWGSETPLLGNPHPVLEWIWDMSIDDELQERYGYPQITEEDKRMILGENQARLFGVDIKAKKKEFGLLEKTAS
jgi:predicted TIM-barrel fold metal-dependent hydrolase